MYGICMKRLKMCFICLAVLDLIVKRVITERHNYFGGGGDGLFMNNFQLNCSKLIC